MFDFSSIPFFDNHTHRIDVSNREIKPIDLGIAFMHGWGPINPTDQPLMLSAEVPNCTPEYEETVMNMGVVKVVVNLLAKKFGCEATPEAVIRERNKRTAQDGYGWAKELYEEEKIIGEVVDDGAPFGDPALGCFPTKIYRLFQMDPFFRKLLAECSTYEELRDRFVQGIRDKIHEGFIGIKCHIVEIRYRPLYVTEEEEAKASFAAAKAGDQTAFENVYMVMFEKVLMLTQEMNFSVHIHTGCTGNPHDLKSKTDPIGIAPIMRDHRFYAAHICFLHGNFPDIRHSALVAHSYPNVWIDISWSLPWLSLNMEQILEEVIAMAPHNKIMLGTGQHNHAEMAWTAAKVAKISLARVMDKLVSHGLLAENQATEIAEQILYRNAMKLYRIQD